MTTVNKNQFHEALGGEEGFIDIKHLDASTERVLQSAGVSPEQLDAIAGDDGLISGKAEMGQLFRLVDSFDANGSAKSFDAGDPNAEFATTASGELFAALKAEADADMKQAQLLGVFGPTARSTSPRKMDDKTLVDEAEATHKRLATKQNYPGRAADEKKLVALDAEIERRYVKKLGIENPYAVSDGTTWAEQQTGRCMTNLEIYEYTLQNGDWGLSPELAEFAQQQDFAFKNYAEQQRLWPDGKVQTQENREKYLQSEYVTRGANALTSNVFGALAWGASGMASDDPWYRLGAAELGANVGGMVLYGAALRPTNVTLIKASQAPSLSPAGAAPAGMNKNSRSYAGPTHVYVITRTDVKTGQLELFKYGVGSTGESTKGISYRPGGQVRDLNKADTSGWVYKSVIIDRTPPNRGEGYNMERDYVTEYMHKRPDRQTPLGNDLPQPWPGAVVPDRQWVDPR